MIEVKVTQEDIDHGKRKNDQECPIALALDRRCPEYEVFVGYEFIKSEEKQYFTTTRALRFILRFDDGLEVKPSTFRFTEV